jgi:hypothetical protein
MFVCLPKRATGVMTSLTFIVAEGVVGEKIRNWTNTSCQEVKQDITNGNAIKRVVG